MNRFCSIEVEIILKILNIFGISMVDIEKTYLGELGN